MEAIGSVLTWLVVPGIALAAALYIRKHGVIKRVRDGMVFAGLFGMAMGLVFTLTGEVSAAMLVVGALSCGLLAAFVWAAAAALFNAGKGTRW